MHALKDIMLPNRYYKKIRLEYLGDYKYKFNDPRLNYLRYIGGNKTTIEAIDPEGGPFIGVGDEMDGVKVVSISRKGIITVEVI